MEHRRPLQPSVILTVLNKKFLFLQAGGGGGGKNNGYTKAYKLSPALSTLMGEVEMPRHEVVRRVWAMIKEKNLYDPNNKQFAICDDALYTVIGVKKFRTFGMMKYLKNHFITS